jgi:hypothetical protein
LALEGTPAQSNESAIDFATFSVNRRLDTVEV